jgi:diacylglycerol kinase family enzyme
MAPTHLLCANPHAQSGRNRERIARAQAELAGLGIPCDLLPTLPSGATAGAVCAALRAADYRSVIAMGGDGTFRDVAAGLLDSGLAEEVTLGFLPTGTANDQGRSFGLDASEAALARNVAVVVAGVETRLDAGRITLGAAPPSYFFDSAGWGISARVLAARNRDRGFIERVPVLRDLYRDQWVYAGALLRTFLESYVQSDKFDAEVEVDGARVELAGLTDLILKNTRVYGGAWVFDPTARHDDGAFEIVPFHGRRDWTSKAIVSLDGNPLTEEMLNQLGIHHSRGLRGARMRFAFRRAPDAAPLCAQVDGEEAPASASAEVTVVPRAVRLLVPAAV